MLTQVSTVSSNLAKTHSSNISQTGKRPSTMLLGLSSWSVGDWLRPTPSTERGEVVSPPSGKGKGPDQAKGSSKGKGKTKVVCSFCGGRHSQEECKGKKKLEEHVRETDPSGLGAIYKFPPNLKEEDRLPYEAPPEQPFPKTLRMASGEHVPNLGCKVLSRKLERTLGAEEPAAPTPPVWDDNDCLKAGLHKTPYLSPPRPKPNLARLDGGKLRAQVAS